MKRRLIELLAFDRNHQLQYEGKCKLQIDRLSSMLLVDPENQEYKMKSVMFKWNFVMDKNFIFVFGEHELNDFALVFDEERRCKKKQDDPGKEMLLNRFVIPLKEKCLKVMEENKNALKSDKNKNNKDLDSIFKKTIDVIELTDDDSDRTSNNRKRKRSQLKKANKSQKDGKKIIPTKKQEPEQQFLTVVDQSLFKFVNAKSRTKFPQQLLIFTSLEKTHCYEYGWNHMKKLYHCTRCKALKKSHSAFCDKDENGLECMKMEDKKHVCTLMPYIAKNYIEVKLFKKPYYETVGSCSAKTDSLNCLIIFDQNNKSQCWEFRREKERLTSFFCRKCAAVARLWNENTEYEYVELKNINHNCKFIPYDPRSYFNDFILPPDFEVQTVSKNGAEKKRLIIFDKNDRHFCYVYSLQGNRFRCYSCNILRLSVTAKLLQNSDGEDYVILSKTEHGCKLRPYGSVQKLPTKERKKIILRQPNFHIKESTENREKKLLIFDSKDQSLCFEFSHKKHNKYCCYGCENVCSQKNQRKKVKPIVAELCKYKNGKFYVRLNDSKHACNPKRYQENMNEKLPDNNCFRHRNSLNFNIRNSSDIDESKIIKVPNFEFLLNKDGVENGPLFIFLPEDRNVGYKYYRDGNGYYCQYRNCRASAKLFINNDGEKCILLGPNEHKCQPVKYGKKIIKSSDFITISKKGNSKVTNVIVFTSSSRDECYEFSILGKENDFRCSACKNVCHHVGAKLFKNENGQYFFQISKQQHICSPRTYIKEKYESLII